MTATSLRGADALSVTGSSVAPSSHASGVRLYWQTGLMLASLAPFAVWRRLRSLSLIWACILFGATVLSAAPSVVADFDGDSQPDRAELSRREPSAVHVWLSATQSIAVVRSSTPILGIAARDLDGDKRAELIAS